MVPLVIGKTSQLIWVLFSYPRAAERAGQTMDEPRILAQLTLENSNRGLPPRYLFYLKHLYSTFPKASYKGRLV